MIRWVSVTVTCSPELIIEGKVCEHWDAVSVEGMLAQVETVINHVSQKQFVIALVPEHLNRLLNHLNWACAGLSIIPILHVATHFSKGYYAFVVVAFHLVLVRNFCALSLIAIEPEACSFILLDELERFLAIQQG